LGWQGHTCVKNLPQVGREVCGKFGGDWSGGSLAKEGLIAGAIVPYSEMPYCHNRCGDERSGVNLS